MLPIGQDHFLEGVTQLRPAVFQIFALSQHLGPFEQLSQLARRNFGISGGKINELGLLMLK